MQTTGKTLRIERVTADITVKALGEATGWSRTTIWTIERTANVKPEHVASYRAALARLTAERAA